MKQLKVILVCISACLVWQPALAQKLTVRGVVTDKYSEPIPGVNVMVKGTVTGTFTDVDGNYFLDASSDAVLEFSSLGFLTKQVNINGQTVLNVILDSDTESLEETVVVAYGTASKATITGALSSVNTEELLKSPVTSVTNMLAGSMPGVASVQSSGQPGKDAATIYIRGCGSLNNSLAAPDAPWLINFRELSIDSTLIFCPIS